MPDDGKAFGWGDGSMQVRQVLLDMCGPSKHLLQILEAYKARLAVVGTCS